MGVTTTSPDLDTLRQLRAGAGNLTAAAMTRLDEELGWYRRLAADDRAWVGLVAGAGIKAFIAWYADPSAPPSAVGDIFAAAPPELTRSISLQHTLQLVRIVVDVVESHSDQYAAPAGQRLLREAVLVYSREVAFSAAEVYARAAEVRGAWDARLEALVIDAIVRGDEETSLRSRIAALGWTGRGRVQVVVGQTTPKIDEVKAGELRRACRRATDDALVGIHGDRLVVILGGTPEKLEAAPKLLIEHFGPGPVVVGPAVDSLNDAARSANEAINGYRAVVAWPQAPRPVRAHDLLPERVLINDEKAIQTLVSEIYRPLQEDKGPLLETLNAYLGSGRSLESAARGLYVHPNTVRYRLRKVSEVTGWDPVDPRESYVLQLALSLGRLREGR